MTGASTLLIKNFRRVSKLEKKRTRSYRLTTAGAICYISSAMERESCKIIDPPDTAPTAISLMTRQFYQISGGEQQTAKHLGTCKRPTCKVNSAHTHVRAYHAYAILSVGLSEGEAKYIRFSQVRIETRYVSKSRPSSPGSTLRTICRDLIIIIIMT